MNEKQSIETFTCEGNPYNHCDFDKLGIITCRYYNEANGSCDKTYLDNKPQVDLVYHPTFQTNKTNLESSSRKLETMICIGEKDGVCSITDIAYEIDCINYHSPSSTCRPVHYRRVEVQFRIKDSLLETRYGRKNEVK